MNDRMSDPSHKKAQDLLRKPGTTVQYTEVDLGTATTRSDRERVLRHYEQQELNRQAKLNPNAVFANARRAESPTKTARNQATIKQHGASQGAQKTC